VQKEEDIDKLLEEQEKREKIFKEVLLLLLLNKGGLVQVALLLIMMLCLIVRCVERLDLVEVAEQEGGGSKEVVLRICVIC
jgi:hypothetical protein